MILLLALALWCLLLSVGYVAWCWFMGWKMDL